ncbi:hypothetical protein L1887_31570 [Cichorium endivia]|nr:hypothetical protein L1887_31570 [Cichorium endivia]
MQKQKLGMEDEQNEYERIKGNGNTPVKGDRTDCRIGRKRFFGIERSKNASRVRLMVRRYYSIRFDQRNPEVFSYSPILTQNDIVPTTTKEIRPLEARH